MVSTHVCKTHGQCQHGKEKSSAKMTRPGTSPLMLKTGNLLTPFKIITENLRQITENDHDGEMRGRYEAYIEENCKSCDSQQFTVNSSHQHLHKSTTRFGSTRIKRDTTMETSRSSSSSSKESWWQFSRHKWTVQQSSL